MLLYALPKIMIICLISTLLIECTIAFILKIREKKDLMNVLLVNILTNPLLVASTTLIKVCISIKAYNIAMPIFELSAFLIEGFIYHKYLTNKKINGFLLSLILNLCSYFLGIVINNIIW